MLINVLSITKHWYKCGNLRTIDGQHTTVEDNVHTSDDRTLQDNASNQTPITDITTTLGIVFVICLTCFTFNL